MNKQNDSDYLPLSKALRQLADDPKTAWLPQSRLRAAVRSGEVESKRSGGGKYARYYVRIADLLTVVK